MVSHNPSFDFNKFCDNIKHNADLSRFTHVKFDKLGKIDMNKVEEAIYEMMDTFKTAPIEIGNALPKSLYKRVEQKWQFNLQTKIKIR